MFLCHLLELTCEVMMDDNSIDDSKSGLLDWI